MLHNLGESLLAALIDKYLDHLWDWKIYVIAIILCPDCKTEWFKDPKLSTQRIYQIKKMVIDCWNESYAPNEDLVPERNKSQSSSGTSKYPLDHIETYLKDDTIPSTMICEAGGYTRCWFQI
ncbi:hypothetical protein K443DRAFT_135633 [Laccaria amethystina LaAM-08-1]|uniref:Uncharacterized protein n=1 Tax=Laccaria amethystina LaAM-08-1 TaxID=1095629 RepID=A0A0C9WH76_9AGAR|nr:hypothetical protein K443DRAFT_135633 [Laccaria amethystina LaAM-08-1]